MQAITRKEQKAIDAATKLVPPGVEVRRYLAGRGRSANTKVLSIAMGAFAVAFVVALALGYIIFPGGLLLLVMINALRPPRGIAIATNGLYVVGLSAFNGRPSKVVGHLPAGSAQLSPDGKTVHVADDRIVLLRADRSKAPDLLGPTTTWTTASAATTPAAASTAAPAAWYPDPAGAEGLRYWDGMGWTDHTAPTEAAPR